MFRVVLDERGEQVTSRELAGKLGSMGAGRRNTVAFLIGGADGHTDELRRKADWCWSLGKLTLQHELALVVAARTTLPRPLHQHRHALPPRLTPAPPAAEKSRARGACLRRGPEWPAIR